MSVQGHIEVGAFWFFMGLFFFLRSLDLETLRPFREHPAWVTLPAWSTLLGGTGHFIVEYIFMTDWFSHVNINHFMMAAMFMVTGSIGLLHQLHKLKGVAWSLIWPSTWCVLGYFWHNHPQHNGYFEFGHKACGWMFIFAGLCIMAEYMVGFFTDRPPSQRPECHLHEDKPEKRFTCNPRYRKVRSMYLNPKVYATPFPFLSGLTLMQAGVFTWNLALLWDEDDPEKMSRMNGMFSFVIHFLGLLIGVAAVTMLFYKLDRIISNFRNKQHYSDSRTFCFGLLNEDEIILWEDSHRDGHYLSRDDEDERELSRFPSP
ncbi:hypothetical protein QOT17_001614 [Balamuthia mandrillaris]